MWVQAMSPGSVRGPGARCAAIPSRRTSSRAPAARHCTTRNAGRTIAAVRLTDVGPLTGDRLPDRGDRLVGAVVHDLPAPVDRLLQRRQVHPVDPELAR